MADVTNPILKKFYVKLPGSNKKTKTVGAEVPVDYDRWLSEIAASKDYPEYKTKSDIIRDAIHIALTLRTDPIYRDVPELKSMRQGILALQGLEHLNNLRATVDELATNLYMATPGTKDGNVILQQAEDFMNGLDDPTFKARLGQSITAYRTR